MDLRDSGRFDKRTRVAIAFGTSACLLAVGLVSHWPSIAAADCMDSDAAVVILMARHFARGEFTPYFWGQRYMGALEPFLLAPFALFGAATAATTVWLATGLAAAQAILSVWLAKRFGGLTWVAALLWALPPATLMHDQTTLYGARLAAGILALAAFAIATRESVTRVHWLAAGVLCGIAFYGDHMMLAWVLPLAWMASRARALRPFLLGVAPLVVLDVAWIAAGSGSLAGPREPVAWLENLPLLAHTVMPLFLGAEWAVSQIGAMATPGWILASVVGLVVLGGLISRSSGRRPRRLPVMALVAVAAGFFVTFVLGGIDMYSVRYLGPAWPALSILASLGAARWSPTWRPVVALVVAPFVFSELYNPLWPTGARAGAGCRAEVQELRATFELHHLGALYCPYSDCYRLAAALDEPFPVSPFIGVDRRSAWTRSAQTAKNVGYLFRDQDAEAHASLVQAAGAGLAGRPDRIGSFTLVVLPRAIPAWRPTTGP